MGLQGSPIGEALLPPAALPNRGPHRKSGCLPARSTIHRGAFPVPCGAREAKQAWCWVDRALWGPPLTRDQTRGPTGTAGTWGTTWHAPSRGRPRASSSAGPRSRRSTSPCPAGLGYREMLAPARPHPARSPPVCPSKAARASTGGELPGGNREEGWAGEWVGEDTCTSLASKVKRGQGCLECRPGWARMFRKGLSWHLHCSQSEQWGPPRAWHIYSPEASGARRAPPQASASPR